MTKKKFTLVASISTESPAKIKLVLTELLGHGVVEPTSDGFTVKARMAGESAKELNRTLLSALRRVEKKTRIRSEWTSSKTTERFFDYVSKGKRKA